MYVEASDAELLITLVILHDGVLGQRLFERKITWVTPLAGYGLGVVDATKVARPRVITSQGVSENDGTGARQSSAQRDFGGKSSGTVAATTAVAEKIALTESLEI